MKIITTINFIIITNFINICFIFTSNLIIAIIFIIETIIIAVIGPPAVAGRVGSVLLSFCLPGHFLGIIFSKFLENGPKTGFFEYIEKFGH